MQDKKTLVSIIVPCRNEKDYISTFIESILSQDITNIDIEVLIADGISDDGTRDKIRVYIEKDSRIRLIDNSDQNTPSALNKAICVAHGEFIVRMDVHTEYASDYIQQCINVLNLTCADNVGGPWNATGRNYLQCAIALAFQSPFSSGGAGSHAIEYEGEVDSVYLGCWRKSYLEKLGLFDEELNRNQDDELNLRIIRTGGKICQSPKIRSWYYPRSSFKALFTQYMQYGYWKVRVIQKHKIPAAWRHLIPGGFVGCLILLAALSPVSTFASWTVSFLIGAYSIANLAASGITCRKPSLLKYLPVIPIVFAAYHFGYGFGFLRGVIDFVFFRKGGHHSFKQLTRR